MIDFETVSFYDALDRRIGFDDSGTQTWTVYDGTNPYGDFNGSGTLLERYLFGPGVVNGAVVDELLARTSSGGTTAWYLTDKLGSVRDIVNSSGTVQDHVVYDSFGNIVTETNAANGDRFKFAGMEYDSTTGQDYAAAATTAPPSAGSPPRTPSASPPATPTFTAMSETPRLTGEIQWGRMGGFPIYQAVREAFSVVPLSLCRTVPEIPPISQPARLTPGIL